VLGQMAFRPRISPNLKEMDPRIFRPGPMGLSQSFAELPARPRRVA
jgi:propionate CoA-transferase